MIWVLLCSVLFGISLVGMVILLKTVGGINEGLSRYDWKRDLPSIAGNHTQVTGVLAGFSITLVVLLVERWSTGFVEQSALGMFIAAFFGYVATGILYSLVSEREKHHQIFLFAAAGALYYLSVLLSFSALLPLLESVGAGYLVLPVILMVVGATVGGYAAVCIPLVDLLRLRRRLCALSFALAVFGAGLLLSIGQVVEPPALSEIRLRASLIGPILLIVLTFVFCMSTFFIEELERKRPLRVAAMSVASVAALITVFIALAAIFRV